MNNPYDPSRQGATPTGAYQPHQDISKYTYSVADAVLAFHQASMSITDRTIQRYCHSGKLRAVRVDPDTRQLTDKDNYLFLIDPTSIPERVAQLREKQEFVSPTVVATRPVTSRPDATSHDMSEPVASVEETDQSDEVKKLREQVMSLEIDKKVRDGLIDQMKEDRKELFSQLEGHVQSLMEESRLNGQLETRLEFAALDQPENSKKPDEPNHPNLWEGDSEVNHNRQDSVQ